MLWSSNRGRRAGEISEIGASEMIGGALVIGKELQQGGSKVRLIDNQIELKGGPSSDELTEDAIYRKTIIGRNSKR